MTTCISSTTKVEDTDTVVTKDGEEVDLEDTDKDATHRLEAVVAVTRTETVPITKLIVSRQDPTMSTNPHLLL